MLLIYEKEGSEVHGDAIRVYAHYCGSSLWWPTWKTRLTSKSEGYAQLWEQEVSQSPWLWCDNALPHTAGSLYSVLGTYCKIPDLTHGVFPM